MARRRLIRSTAKLPVAGPFGPGSVPQLPQRSASGGIAVRRRPSPQVRTLDGWWLVLLVEPAGVGAGWHEASISSRISSRSPTYMITQSDEPLAYQPSSGTLGIPSASLI